MQPLAQTPDKIPRHATDPRCSSPWKRLCAGSGWPAPACPATRSGATPSSRPSFLVGDFPGARRSLTGSAASSLLVEVS